MAEFDRSEILIKEDIEYWNIPEIDNDILAQETLKYIDDRVSDNDYTPWSEDTIVDSEAPETAKLIEEVNSILAYKGLVMQGIWGQIHRKYESTQLHDHVPDYAWVYYVKTPPKAGALMIVIRRANYPAYKIKVQPKAGQLIMFSHWIEHQVNKNLDDEYRISIAGNAVYR